ncbi:DUF5136 domain-containing protein [Streptomyces sp. SID8377]|nr:DUF5136 domain-containing protein [Streptomyces sp. SID8377]
MVGEPWSPPSKASPLASFHRFLTNVVHTIQLHTPKAVRNQETGRLSFMRPVCGPPCGPLPRGRPADPDAGRRPRRPWAPPGCTSGTWDRSRPERPPTPAARPGRTVTSHRAELLPPRRAPFRHGAVRPRTRRRYGPDHRARRAREALPPVGHTDAARADVGGRRGSAGAARHPGQPADRRPRPAREAHLAVVDRLRRRDRGGAGRPQPALEAAPRQHAQDAVRGHGAAQAGQGADPQGAALRPRRRRRGQQSRGHQGEPHLHRPRPVARGLPPLRERRRPRPVLDERRRGRDRPGDAAQGRGPAGGRHHGDLPRRLRHARPGLLGVRPDALRPLRPAERGLPRVLLDRARPVPRRVEEDQGEEGQEGHQEALDLRDPEHQPVALR